MEGYSQRQNGPWRYLVVPRLEAEGLVHFFGLKGTSQLAQNSGACFDGLPVVMANQVHRDEILVMRDPEGGKSSRETQHDAVMTASPGFFVGVYTADCLPLLLADPIKKIVAAVHAGWRGSTLGIAIKAVRKMVREMASRPQHILAAMGPRIGPCCYEVGEAVLNPLAKQYADLGGMVRAMPGGKGMLDLSELNRRQLIQAGLRAENILIPGGCTYCDPKRFSSYRRDGKGTPGMISAIMRPH